MKLICAIDLLGGAAVRLEQGDRNRVTRYADDPRTVVDAFADAGVRMVHLVDLDGAFGEPPQTKLLTTLIERAHGSGAIVEVGGGLRDRESVLRVLATGCDQVVVGTLALRQPEVAQELCREHPGRVVIAADAKAGMVAVDGWREATSVTASDLAQRAQAWGAVAVLYTDIGRDGMQHGAAVEATAALQSAVSIDVYASGGIGSLADLDACRTAGIRGVVVGRAIYERSFTLQEALSRC